MKAPDKIYVLPEVASVVKVLDEEVEYIRKDALLEWAKAMRRVCKAAEPIEKAYQTMIDKLNKM